MNRPQLSFVIPCLNEARTLEAVISDCQIGGLRCGCPFEILIADNGSTDGSRQVAEDHGARVVAVSERGYGAALAGGVEAASGDFILMGDADSTYEFERADEFLSRLQEGYDLVMGNRFQGTIAKGAMPFLHRYLGNPVLSSLGKVFFGIRIGDFHCGLRGFRRNSILGLGLNCKGMEYASEMVIKASLANLRITEIPTNLRPNPPGRETHLKTWRDGWRHLKFMLSFCPKYSFLPLAMIAGLLAGILILAFAFAIEPFSGTNTLVFAFCCLVATMAIISDYILTRDIIYSEHPRLRSPLSLRLDLLLGLRKGTDRLFKLAGWSFCGGLLGMVSLTFLAGQERLDTRLASLTSVLACTLILAAIFFYLTAAKISTYRSVHT